MQLLDKEFTVPEVVENVHPLCTSSTRRVGTTRTGNIKNSGRNKMQTARAKPEPVAADEDESHSDSITENMEQEHQLISPKLTTSSLDGEELVMAVKAAIQEEERNLAVIELALVKEKLGRMKKTYLLELGIPLERLPGVCGRDLQVARVGDEPLASTQYAVDEWV